MTDLFYLKALHLGSSIYILFLFDQSHVQKNCHRRPLCRSRIRPTTRNSPNYLDFSRRLQCRGSTSTFPNAK